MSAGLMRVLKSKFRPLWTCISNEFLSFKYFYLAHKISVHGEFSHFRAKIIYNTIFNHDILLSVSLIL